MLSGFTGIDAYNGKGEDYDELGDHKKALADFGQALTINPNDVFVFANRVLVISLIEKQR